jgi:DNA-binding NarL/FixJ family response regulator
VKTRVAIIDDEESMRDALRLWLDHSDEFQCVGSWSNPADAARDILWKKPEVTLLDLHLAKGTSIEAIAALKLLLPEMKVITLTGEEDYYWIERALKSGADGYLLKATIRGRLAGAITEALAGGCPLSGQVSRKLVNQKLQPGVGDQYFSSLTPRERLVLHEMSDGMVYKEIAAKHSISPETVRTHVRQIFKKLRVHNRTEAVLAYMKGQS